MTNTVDELRKQYMNMAPYPYEIIVTDDFTPEELGAIEKYGHWFNAI